MDRAQVMRAIVSIKAVSTHPVVVALDGRSGSGKSTLAAELAPMLRAAVVAGDDFYRVLSDADRRALHAAEGVARYFDWERLREEALVPLRGDRPATFHPYDWHTAELATQVREIPSREVVLVEGVYSARSELADLVDLAVLVEVDRTTRLGRLAARGDASGWQDRWESAEAYYFSTLRPPETFDAVVPGR
jgi:uridine kinase